MQAAPGLTDMPQGVLVDILRAAGQPARVQSMVTCKALWEAATAEGTWDSVSFVDLDSTALEFMQRHRCRDVQITSVTPDDVSWFLSALAERGCDDCIATLRLQFGRVQRLPEDLLDAVSMHGSLRSLDIRVDHCERHSDLVWPRRPRLLRLEQLVVVECTERQNVTVWWNESHSCFPELRSLELRVGVSDVMTAACQMPRLRRLVYRFDQEGGETYEDACLAGSDLDVLELTVDDDTDTRHLFHQLELASVRRLVLHMADDYLDVCQPLSPALEELVLGMSSTNGSVILDFPFLAQARKLRLVELGVTDPAMLDSPGELAACHHLVVFQHTSPDAWRAMFNRVRLQLLPTTRVCISPF